MSLSRAMLTLLCGISYLAPAKAQSDMAAQAIELINAKAGQNFGYEVRTITSAW